MADIEELRRRAKQKAAQSVAQERERKAVEYAKNPSQDYEGLPLPIAAGLSFIDKAPEVALTGIEHLGRTADYLGKVSRSTLAGEPKTGYRENFSGRDALEKYGILGKNTPGLDAGDVAGFGWEVVADPLTYLTAGIGKAVSAAGKAAKFIKGAGLIDDFARANPQRILSVLDDASDASKAARTALQARGVTRAMAEAATTNTDELAKLTKALEVGKTWGDKIRRGEGGLATASIPFTDKGINLGTGEISAKMADVLGKVGGKLYRSPVSRATLGQLTDDAKVHTALPAEQADIANTVLRLNKERGIADVNRNVMKALEINAPLTNIDDMERAYSMTERSSNPMAVSIRSATEKVEQATPKINAKLARLADEYKESAIAKYGPKISAAENAAKAEAEHAARLSALMERRVDKPLVASVEQAQSIVERDIAAKIRRIESEKKRLITAARELQDEAADRYRVIAESADKRILPKNPLTGEVVKEGYIETLKRNIAPGAAPAKPTREVIRLSKSAERLTNKAAQLDSNIKSLMDKRVSLIGRATDKAASDPVLLEANKILSDVGGGFSKAGKLAMKHERRVARLYEELAEAVEQSGRKATNNRAVVMGQGRIKALNKEIHEMRQAAARTLKESPIPKADAADAVERSAAMAKGRYDDILKTEKDWGVESYALDNDYMDYAKRIAINPKEKAGTIVPKARNLQNVYLGEARSMAREADTISYDKAREAMGLGPQYRHDVGASVLFRQAVHDRAVNTASTIHDLIRNMPEAAAGQATILSDDLIRQVGLDPAAPKWAGLTGKAIPQEAVDFVARQLKPWKTPEAIRPALDVFDKVTQIYKTALTVPFPAFDARNVFSNIILQLQNGQSPASLIRNYKRAFDIARGKDVAIDVVGLGRIDTKRFLQLTAETGITERNFIDDVLRTTVKGDDVTDVMQDAMEQMARGADGFQSPLSAFKSAKGVYGKPIAVMKAKSRWIENVSRVSSLLDGLDKGMDFTNAARYAKTSLFDYGALTQAEKHIYKRMFPFWTFARKNIEAQTKFLFTQPGQFNIANKLFSQASDKDRADMPDYWRREFISPFGKAANGDPVFVHGFGTPFEDYAEKTTDPKSNLSMLNPMLKSVIEYMTNRNTFTGRDIADENKAWNFSGKLPKPLQDLLGVEKVKDKHGKERVFQNPNTKWWLNQTPLSRLIATLSKASGDETPLQKALGSTSGMRIDSLDIEGQRNLNQQKKLRDLMRKLASQGKAGKTEIFYDTGDSKEIKALNKELKRLQKQRGSK